MSDTENKTPEAAPAQQTDWKAIITDMLILVAATGTIGGLCNLAMKPFETVNPTDSLISLVRKGGNTEKDWTAFHKELREGTESNSTPDQLFINIPDQTGRTVLMWAAYANFNAPNKALKKDLLERIPYVEELIKIPGIDLHAVDKDGFTALHWAAWSGMPATAYALVKAGLDVNQVEGNGYTPLMLAARRGNAEVTRMLLQMGADPNLANKEGKTALQLAQEEEYAYKQRDNWKYTLIFSEAREDFYKQTVAALTHPAAVGDPGREALHERATKSMKSLLLLDLRKDMAKLVAAAKKAGALDELVKAAHEMAARTGKETEPVQVSDAMKELLEPLTEMMDTVRVEGAADAVADTIEEMATLAKDAK